MRSRPLVHRFSGCDSQAGNTASSWEIIRKALSPARTCRIRNWGGAQQLESWEACQKILWLTTGQEPPCTGHNADQRSQVWSLRSDPDLAVHALPSPWFFPGDMQLMKPRFWDLLFSLAPTFAPQELIKKPALCNSWDCPVDWPAPWRRKCADVSSHSRCGWKLEAGLALTAPLQTGFCVPGSPSFLFQVLPNSLLLKTLS